MSDTGKWIIGYRNKRHEKEITDQYSSDTRLQKLWPSFVRDVSTNPYFHPKKNRIVKLKDKRLFPNGSYRYSKAALRVVYYPEKDTKVVYPLEVASATDVSYKRKSSG